MGWDTVLTISVIALLAMLSPGPDFFLVVKNAARYSRRAALATTLGINVGIAVHMSYCVLGLVLIIQQTPWLFDLLKYAGAGYLIWIGVQALLSRGGVSSVTDENGHTQQQVPFWRAFSEGLLCNLLNPKVTLFFFSVFTQLLQPDSSLHEKILIALIIFLLGIVYWPLLVLLIQQAWVLRALRRVQHTVDRVLGGVLLALGIKVALS